MNYFECNFVFRISNHENPIAFIMIDRQLYELQTFPLSQILTGNGKVSLCC